MAFSEEIKTRAMVACGRCCCICHKFCGNNMEVHHIKAEADGGSNTFENAIPLCFDCHAEVRQYDPRHPKGIKFSEKELIQHRDNWYNSIKNRTEPNNKSDSPPIEPIRIVRNKDELPFLHRVMTGQELISLASNMSALEYSYDSPNSREEAMILADFVQKARDLIDYCDIFMEPSDSIMTVFELNDDIKALEESGFWLFCAVDNRTVTGGVDKPDSFPTLIMKIVRSDSKEIIKVSDLTKSQKQKEE